MMESLVGRHNSEEEEEEEEEEEVDATASLA